MGWHKRSFRSKAECTQKYNFAQMFGKRSSEFPNVMNKYFSSIGHNLASKMPNPPKQFSEYLSDLSHPCSFIFNPVSPLEIENEIMKTPLNKAHALYSFSSRIFRSAKHIISQPVGSY